MMQVGLTGGLGAGKSLIARVFGTLGVPVYDSDLAARRLMEQDSALKPGIISLFGKEVYNEAGRLQRKKIASLVFGNEELLTALNALVHPAVKSDYLNWLHAQSRGRPYVIREAAIMIETGLYRDLDALILVDAPVELRIERVVKRDGRSPEEIKSILSRQWDTEKKKPFASYIIPNDGKVPILPLILDIHSKLTLAGAATTN